MGNMGSGHARSIMEGKCPDFDLVAVADINPARVEWGKANLAGNIRYFDDALAMLDSGCLDACMVCVPHYDHPRYAMACMQRGIHVMVEKPAGVYTCLLYTSWCRSDTARQSCCRPPGRGFPGRRRQ